MLKFLNKIDKKIDTLIWTYISTGVILLLLAILVVWNDFIFRLTCGLVVIVISYTFIFAGFRLWEFKKEIKSYLKIKK